MISSWLNPHMQNPQIQRANFILLTLCPLHSILLSSFTETEQCCSTFFFLFFLISQWEKAAIIVVATSEFLILPTTFPWVTLSRHYSSITPATQLSGASEVGSSHQSVLVHSLVSCKFSSPKFYCLNSLYKRRPMTFLDNQREHLCVLKHIKRLSFNQHHHYDTLFTHILCGDKDLPRS